MRDGATGTIVPSPAKGQPFEMQASALRVIGWVDDPPRTPEGKLDFAQDFFGREAFLTVAGQLNVEAYCLALTKVYTFGRPSAPRTRTPAATSPSSG